MDSSSNQIKDNVSNQQSSHNPTLNSAAPRRNDNLLLSTNQINKNLSEKTWTQVNRPRNKPRWKNATDLYPSLYNRLDAYFIIKNTETKQIIDNRPAIFADLKKHGISRENISELRDGSLLIKCQSSSISQNLSTLNSLGGVNIKAAPHPTLNKSQGTIFAPSLANISDADILENLQEFGVVDLYRLKDRVNGKLRPSHRILLTFNTIEPPEKIYYTWLPFSVRRHIPTPRRCYNCQIFGHVGSKCTRPNICFYCGQPEHINQVDEDPTNRTKCQNPPKCFNCNEPHPASSRNCIFFKYESEILAMSIMAKISHSEARKKVRTLNGPTGITYADALKGCHLKKVQSQGISVQTFSQEYIERRLNVGNQQRTPNVTKETNKENKFKTKSYQSTTQEKLDKVISSSPKPTGTRPKQRITKNKRAFHAEEILNDSTDITPSCSPVSKLQKIRIHSSYDNSSDENINLEVHRENRASQYLPSSTLKTKKKENEETLLNKNPTNLEICKNISYSLSSISSFEDSTTHHQKQKYYRDSKDIVEKAVESAEKCIHSNVTQQKYKTDDFLKTTVEPPDPQKINKIESVISNRK